MAAAAAGGDPPALSEQEQDIQTMLASDVHVETKNYHFQMERYVIQCQSDGTPYIIDSDKTWEKLLMAHRVIVANENRQASQLQTKRLPGSLELNKKRLPRRHRAAHGR